MASKLALITGSTSGIGLGIAKVLASKGHDIMLHGFGTAEAVQSAIQTCRDAAPGDRTGEFHHHGGDLSDPKQIEDLYKFTQDKFSQTPDILVNNAGVQHVAPLEEFPAEKWDLLLSVNLSASFHTIKLALPGMRERGWGRVVNICSAHGLVASVQKSAYIASKFGLVGFTKAVALETAGSGITSNAICPGFVLTPLTMPQVEAIVKERGISFNEAKGVMVGGKIPSKEFIMPDEIGAMTAYLCMDDASQVTGATFSIDGGWTAQ